MERDLAKENTDWDVTIFFNCTTTTIINIIIVNVFIITIMSTITMREARVYRALSFPPPARVPMRPAWILIQFENIIIFHHQHHHQYHHNHHQMANGETEPCVLAFCLFAYLTWLRTSWTILSLSCYFRSSLPHLRDFSFPSRFAFSSPIKGGAILAC